MAFCVAPSETLPNTREIYRQCGGHVEISSPYRGCFDDLIEAMIRHIAMSGDRVHYEIIRNPLHCAGVVICYHQIPAQACQDCLDAADIKLFSGCSTAEIARIRLNDCYLRYHNESISDE
ncbi:hypothetical protein MLD38_029740 [Melastoma candidum]|uniref:Uncharacterized protein n=2 Tax=Melastoma candidum TaxID=119954 RepID=A0ACB9N6N1_9MYRT|nr:hypothetical protein MLD38_029739 [Melastoma candidum]KAI4331562.1 hypothetical protein MLD38_029740 [Melastoma candidum]